VIYSHSMVHRIVRRMAGYAYKHEIMSCPAASNDGVGGVLGSVSIRVVPSSCAHSHLTDLYS
jgi:hypothetical protein